MNENNDASNGATYKQYYIVCVGDRYDYLFYTDPKPMNYIKLCMEDLDRVGISFDEIKSSECSGHLLDPNTEEVRVIFRAYFKADYKAHTFKVYIKYKTDSFGGYKKLSRVYTFLPEQKFRKNDRLMNEIVNDLNSRQEEYNDYFY